MSNCCDRFVMIEGEEDSFETWQGLRGPYYTPSVSEDGTLSWTNNGDLQNPANVNIIGPPGEQGPAGDPGPGVAEGGTTGQLLAKSSDEDYDTEWIDQPEMDAGHVSYDSTEAYDDGTVGKELTTINSALTSLSSVTEIIDTASGAIASFPDGSGLPMRSLLATIEPQQDLHGQSSPYPAGGGKNLFDVDSLISGGITGQGGDAANSGWRRTPYMYMKAGTYTISRASADWWKMFKYSEQSTSSIIGQVFNNNTRLTETFTLDTDCYCRFGFDYIPTTADAIQLEAGSTATAWSPYSNICPITGHTGLSVEVTGVNIAEFTHGKGIDTGGHIHDFATRSATVTPIKIDNTRQYKYVNSNSNTAGIYAVWNGETLVRRVAGMTSGTVMDTSGGDSLYVCGYSGDGDVLPETCGVFFADQYEEFKPYTGTTTTVTFPDSAGTVYGGSYEVVGGELLVDKLITDFDEDRTYYEDPNRPGVFYFGIAGRQIVTSTTDSPIIACSVYKVNNVSVTTGEDCYISGVQSYGGGAVFFRDTRLAGKTSAEVKQALSGQKIVFVSGSPQTFTHEGQSVDTLVGQNNVFVDTGDVSVTYQASIKGYIDKVLGQ